GGAADLYLIPAGKASPRSTDLVSLPFFEEELRRLEDQYDLVVIYAPPLSTSMNGAIIASNVHVSPVLIDVDLCTRRLALEALTAFERLNIKPSGVVLVNVKIKGRERAGGAGKAEVAAVSATRDKKRKKAPAAASAVPPPPAPAAAAAEPVPVEETEPEAA